MRRVKSAPANISEMVNRKKPNLENKNKNKNKIKKIKNNKDKKIKSKLKSVNKPNNILKYRNTNIKSV